MRAQRSIPILLIAFLPALTAAQPGAQEPSARAPRPRVLVLGSHADGNAALEALAGLLERDDLCEVRRADWPGLNEEAAAWPQVLAIAGPPPAAEMDRSLGEVLGAVRSGKGLIAAGEAAAALLASRKGAELLGIVEPAPEGAGGKPGADGAAAGADIAAAVLDQSHPVTQCITHFRHRGRRRGIEVARSAYVLAAAGPLEELKEKPSALEPVIWTQAIGRGRVLAALLDHRDGPSRGIAAVIIRRSAQWLAGRDVTVRLEGEYDLAAESLGAGDDGLAPGVAAAKGFYRGRQIAPVMGFGGAGWLEREDRELTEKPEEVLDRLGIAPGSTAVDLGAGSGYFTFRLARRVGPQGKVIAADLQEEMLAILRGRMEKEGVKNIETVLAGEDDPKLAANSADLVLMVDVYHELARPAPVLAAVKRALRPGGRLVLVEYRGEDPVVPIKPLHRLTLRQARAELKAAGFGLKESLEFLPLQRVLVFTAE